MSRRVLLSLQTHHAAMSCSFVIGERSTSSGGSGQAVHQSSLAVARQHDSTTLSRDSRPRGTRLYEGGAADRPSPNTLLVRAWRSLIELRIDEALAAADEALQRTERNEALWWMPEALRMKGELLLRSRKVDTANAEELFRRSLALTHRQGALFWELRTATSLARLHRESAHRDETRAALSTVCDRFSEGFDAKDFKTAKGLLDSLTSEDLPS